MSSVPPNMPPGGGAPPPYPPYDPKTQWRIYREQQRASWRAQRDAWKAQRHAWKAGYGGAYGPRVPSVVGPIILIGIGVVALLVITGHITASSFWIWYAHWWPLLLIGAGLALLGEWALDARRKVPVRRSANFVGILLLLALLGFGAAGWNQMGQWFGNWGDQDNSFFNFGLPEHDSDQTAMSQPLPANATVDIENPRGDVSITAGDGSDIEVQAHELAYADSDSGAQNIFDEEKAALTVSGSAAVVKSNANDHGRVNLTVIVPHSARVTVNAGRGDVTATGLDAGVVISAAHGDTHLNAISGPVVVHFLNGKHDFSARGVLGDVTADGDCNDLSLSDVKGKVTQSGEIFGDVEMENIAGPILLHTSVTNLQIASLPGDLTLDSDDLHVTEAQGAVRVSTHAKDVDLSQIYGDTFVEDRDGTITVEPAGAYSIDAKNSKGDVEITLPPNASAIVDGRTHNGDIVTDFGLTVNGDEDKTVSGKIGSGSAHIYLNSDNGDLRIKRGPAFPPAPPGVQAAPLPPAPPNARHLRSKRALPPQPVTQ